MALNEAANVHALGEGDLRTETAARVKEGQVSLRPASG